MTVSSTSTASPAAEVTVRRAVARLRGKRIEAYVPLEAPWGSIAQADFGGAVVTIARRAHRGRAVLHARQGLQGALRGRLPDGEARSLPRRPRRGLRVLRRRLCRGLVRQPQDRGHEDPVRARTASSTSASARCAPTTCSTRASARPGAATRRARWRTSSATCAATRSCRTRARSRRWRPSTRTCAPGASGSATRHGEAWADRARGALRAAAAPLLAPR